MKFFLYLTVLSYLCGLNSGMRPLLAEQIPGQNRFRDQITIENLPPGPTGGQGYRLTYIAPAPIDVYWRFKTDFDNNFLKENKFILSHRFIRRDEDTVITENEYSTKPNVVFRWKTRFSIKDYRLDFVLLNPESTGHEFHYGKILLSPQGETTRVVQEGYFNFFGASLWAVYPWSGGMKAFLKYTAQWECDMVLKNFDQYAR